MTTTDIDGADHAELLERRGAAIDEAGWGARFHLFQPRNLCLWVYALLVLMGAHQLFQLAAPTAVVFKDANLAAVGSAGFFCLVFLWFLHRFDWFERTPALLAAAAFIGGGVGAAWTMALPGNSALMDLYTKAFGQAWASDWKAGFTAPLVEESAKGIVFVLMLGLAPRVINTVYDGLIVGAYVGLGFQVLEDMLYGQNAAQLSFGADQVGSVLHTFVIRSATGVTSHAMYTAIVSAGIIYIVGTPAQPRKVGRGMLLILAVVLIHGSWDSMLAFGGENGVVVWLLMLGITIFSVVVLFTALRWGGHRERAWMRDVLAPEVANGTITELELTALAGESSRRRRDRKTAVKGRADGLSKHQEKRIFAAIHDLAHDLSTSHGHETPEVEHSRAEIDRMRAL